MWNRAHIVRVIWIPTLAFQFFFLHGDGTMISFPFGSDKHIVLVLLSLLIFGPGGLQAGNWPDFRGPKANGHVDGELPREWSEKKNVIWKTPIHDRGWSTPAIWGDQVWLTTASNDGTRFYGVAIDRKTGVVLMDKLLFRSAKPEPLGNKVNTYASPSPVIDEERVYLHFGSYGTVCFDTKTLKPLWERTDFPCLHFRGPGSSPFIYKDTLILTFDGVDFQYLVALDRRTGKTLWRRDRSTDFKDLDQEGKPAAGGDFRKAYNTPIIAPMADGSVQLISPGARAAWAYNPNTGAELWQLPYDQFSGAARAIFEKGTAYINSGYSKADLYAVELTGHERGTLEESSIKWVSSKRIPNRSSVIMIGGRLYFVNDGGVASCVEPETGEVIWSERLKGQFSSSPIYAGGVLYLFNEQGAAFLIEPGPEFKLLQENQLDDGMLASPSSDGKDLYLRTKTHLYRISSS
ncbi:MAG: PQQ-binding-like beta-propeller repeat protein [Verrucomicrobiota bacterium]